MINVVYDSHELAQSCVALMEVGPRSHTGRYCFVAECPLRAKSGHRSKCHCFFLQKLRGLKSFNRSRLPGGGISRSDFILTYSIISPF